jgi:hypothetical protein
LASSRAEMTISTWLPSTRRSRQSRARPFRTAKVFGIRHHRSGKA